MVVKTQSKAMARKATGGVANRKDLTGGDMEVDTDGVGAKVQGTVNESLLQTEDDVHFSNQSHFCC